MKNAGVEVKTVPVAPTQADMSSAAASAISSSRRTRLRRTRRRVPGGAEGAQVGRLHTAKIGGIDPCTSPPALAAAGYRGGRADLRPAVLLARLRHSRTPTWRSRSWSKYGAEGHRAGRSALAGLGSVINIQKTLSAVKDLTASRFCPRSGRSVDHPNFLAHAYTCDRTQVPGSGRVMQRLDDRSRSTRAVKTISAGSTSAPVHPWRRRTDSRAACASTRPPG